MRLCGKVGKGIWQNLYIQFLYCYYYYIIIVIIIIIIIIIIIKEYLGIAKLSLLYGQPSYNFSKQEITLVYNSFTRGVHKVSFPLVTQLLYNLLREATACT